jgi:hypothetical protein
MSSVTVVVASWDRRGLLERLLGLLGRQTAAIKEIVVVDNGSTDGSAESAEAAGARVIRMGWNSGFARAVNCGIQAAHTEWVAVVNNDVEPAPDWLERLVEAAEREEAWFATGKLLNGDRIDGTFDLICRGGCAWRAGHGRPDGPEWDQQKKIRLAPFTAALFRRELFERVGLLDEQFESYLEDVDFGLRCARSGLRGVYVPGAVASHAGSATLGKWHPETVRRMSRNQLLLVAKHLPLRWPVLVAQTLWWGVAIRHGAGMAFLRGKAEGLGKFRAARAAAAGQAGGIAGIMEESEGELFALQQQSGFDLFWRLYFALT